MSSTKTNKSNEIGIGTGHDKWTFKWSRISTLNYNGKPLKNKMALPRFARNVGCLAADCGQKLNSLLANRPHCLNCDRTKYISLGQVTILVRFEPCQTFSSWPCFDTCCVQVGRRVCICHRRVPCEAFALFPRYQRSSIRSPLVCFRKTPGFFHWWDVGTRERPPHQIINLSVAG